MSDGRAKDMYINLGGKLAVEPTETFKDGLSLGVTVFVGGGFTEGHG
jgi:hypothetical protein